MGECEVVACVARTFAECDGLAWGEGNLEGGEFACLGFAWGEVEAGVGGLAVYGGAQIAYLVVGGADLACESDVYGDF